jgi:hypothetical protein
MITVYLKKRLTFWGLVGISVAKQSIIIGIPKEIKNNENRVALTPGGASSLILAGHQVSWNWMH